MPAQELSGNNRDSSPAPAGASAAASPPHCPRPGRASSGSPATAPGWQRSARAARRQLHARWPPTRPIPSSPGQLIDRYRPARRSCSTRGRARCSRPLHRHTWQTFSRHWDVDVQQAFHWTREALLRPARPGQRGHRASPAGRRSTARRCPAVTRGPRPRSGSSPPTPRAESEREALGIRFTSVLPQLTPATGLGAAAVAAYAARQAWTSPPSSTGSGRPSPRSRSARKSPGLPPAPGRRARLPARGRGSQPAALIPREARCAGPGQQVP